MDQGFGRYRKRATLEVTAVRVDLETDGFEYQKWGNIQRCKKGDWLLDNAGDVYTVDADTFARTYKEVSPGRFTKTGTVWAKEADAAGTIRTKEGETEYRAGDFLVYNDSALQDGYAVERSKFIEMYDPED